MDNPAACDGSVRLTRVEVEALRSEFPGLPEEYLAFLVDFGYGVHGRIHFYSGPVPPGDIYESEEGLEDLLLFGDDGQGYCYGFETRGFQVVEVSPEGEADRSTLQAFSDFRRDFA